MWKLAIHGTQRQTKIKSKSTTSKHFTGIKQLVSLRGWEGRGAYLNMNDDSWEFAEKKVAVIGPDPHDSAMTVEPMLKSQEWQRSGS